MIPSLAPCVGMVGMAELQLFFARHSRPSLRFDPPRHAPSYAHTNNASGARAPCAPAHLHRRRPLPARAADTAFPPGSPTGLCRRCGGSEPPTAPCVKASVRTPKRCWNLAVSPSPGLPKAGPDPTSPTSVTCDARPLHGCDTYLDP